MFKNFLKYFSVGIFWAFVSFHFPSLPVAGYALTLGLAFGILGSFRTCLLAMFLSLLYSAHSVSPPLAWFLPALIALILLGLWNAYLSWPRPLQGILVMSLVLCFQWGQILLSGMGSAFPLFDFFRVWLGSVAAGWILWPVFSRALRRLLEKIPRPKKTMGELPLYLQNKDRPFKKDWGRRPFGLERGR